MICQKQNCTRKRDGKGYCEFHKQAAAVAFEQGYYEWSEERWRGRQSLLASEWDSDSFNQRQLIADLIIHTHDLSVASNTQRSSGSSEDSPR
jgi:hypothetical protein